MAGIVGLAVVAVLAFGVFGVQTAFIDDRVDEDDPFAASTGTTAASTATSADSGSTDSSATGSGSADSDSTTSSSVTDTSGPTTSTGDAVRVVASNNGELVDVEHQGQGTINVITDGQQTFLRFEDDFAIDNGPDLNVYLSRGVDAAGPASELDDDFVDLGDLKGNVGAQNYEVPADVDVAEYDTVVIWCVRFGVAFNAADLVPA